MGDLEFVRRCVKNEKGAWGEFLKRYSRLIYSHIRACLDVQRFTQDEANIDDLFQEIICLLISDNYQKLKSFKALNGCSLAGWLRQVTLNHTIDYIRRTKPPMRSMDEELDDEGLSLKDLIADTGPDAPSVMNDKEMLGSLKECINKLDTDDKFFMELYLNKGCKPKELKEILNVSRAAVDMRKSRILERLKDCFRSKGIPLDF